VPFTVRPPAATELDEGDPEMLVRENALRKARVAWVPGTHEAVLGCDTVVALDGVVYGKPSDEEEARATLEALSDATHEVLSGLALLLGGERSAPVRGGAAAAASAVVDPSARAGRVAVRTGIARTAVTFRSLGEELLEWYLATGEWRERAGAYAIQGAGAALVRSLEGDYENVVGLPLATLLDLYPELLSR
jgi:nucleoside triphosphate pyrophosphatase